MDRLPLIEAARGKRPFDLAITNVQLVNVFTCEIYPADIGIVGNRIALVGPAGAYQLEAKAFYDGSGKWACPGFVDTHLHIESSMVTPANYAAAVLPFGTTTSIIDPHEIGNVLGMEGIRYMLEASEGIPLRTYLTISSCVPAVPGKETAGADFGPAEVAEMLSWPRVIALGEMMDFMGIVNGNPKMVGIVEEALKAGVKVQGHSPLLSGRDLNAYIASGIDNDHELRIGEEGVEKLRLGLLPLLKVSTFGNYARPIVPKLLHLSHLELALCTDDISPSDLLENGHMDRVIREMLYHGVDPAVAIRWATLNGARHYQLRDHGAIAPGYLADIVLLSSLEEVRASEVFVDGQLLVENGKLIQEIPEPATTIEMTNSVQIRPLSTTDFHLKPPIANGEVTVNVMELLPTRLSKLTQMKVRVKDGQIDPASLGDDICTIAIVPRHGQSHPPVVALLKGLGLKQATLASTIAHDSHNILITGHRPEDMLLAVQELTHCGGGLIFVENGNILGKVDLPLAGLMSPKPVAELAVEMQMMDDLAVELGIPHRAKALSTTGLALTVIPEVRFSDLLGMMDVDTQEPIPVFPDFV
ncbi:MAG: adenine deaminase [Anaerolineales bacterium]|nr:adenine deaminase [Anaerolineales bacterium]